MTSQNPNQHSQVSLLFLLGPTRGLSSINSDRWVKALYSFSQTLSPSHWRLREEHAIPVVTETQTLVSTFRSLAECHRYPWVNSRVTGVTTSIGESFPHPPSIRRFFFFTFSKRLRHIAPFRHVVVVLCCFISFYCTNVFSNFSLLCVSAKT